MAVIDRIATVFCSKKETMAKTIIHCVAVEAGTVGFLGAQFPAVDRFPIGVLQFDMVRRLAIVYGKRMDRARILAFVQAAAATLVGTEAANQVIKYVPGVGNLSNMTIAGSITETIGWMAVDMFKNDNGLIGPKET